MLGLWYVVIAAALVAAAIILVLFYFIGSNFKRGLNSPKGSAASRNQQPKVRNEG